MESPHAVALQPNKADAGSPIERRPQEVLETTGFKADEFLPVALYEGRFGRPYATDVLGIIDAPQKSLDAYSRAKLETIENFMLSKMRDDGIKDTKENYTMLVNKVLEMIGVTKDIEPGVKMDKLFNIVNMVKLGTYKPKVIQALREIIHDRRH